MASSDSKGFFFFANSLPPQIRAPLTLELDDSEADISSHATLSQSDYTSQEEQEEEHEEEFVEDDECVELSPMHAAPLRATPFAHLSTFTDEEEEEEEAIRGDTLSLARVSGNTFGAPTIELLDSEEENHQPSIYVNSLPVSQSLLANDFESFSGSDDDKLYVDDEPGQGQVLGIRVACDEFSTSSATDSDVISQHSQNEQFGSARVVFDELESVKLIEADGVEYYEDYNNSLVKEQDMSFNHLPEHNSHVHCMAGEPVSEAFAENVEYSTPTQTREANADGGVAADQVSDCENLVSIATSVVNSNAEFHDSSAGFESNFGIYEGSKTLSVESCELFNPTLLPECYLEKHLSKDVSLEDELFCDYDSHENVKKLDLGYTAKEEATEAFAENVEYSTPTQTTEANADGGVVAADQVSDCENLVSITTSVVNSNAEFHDSSAGFESNYGVYEGNKTLSVESCELFYPTLLPECYLEKDLSKDVSLEDELFCDYDSHENVEKLDLGYTAKEEATVELNSACQESESESCASDGDAGLMSVAIEQFKEQISALSILLGSKGSGKDSLGIRVIRSSHGTMDLPQDDAKVRFMYADGDAESDGSSGTVTSADESSVICLEEVPDGFSSLPYSNARTGFQHSITKKEKEKIQKMQTISVKFLRLVQRLNLSIEDSLVSKVLCRLVADIERRLNQEFVIRSAKSLAKKLEENCPHDLDFSLNILVLGESGVGKSATINSIFGEMKVVTSAFEPATTSIKEVCGTIDGIKIRILDTPGLKSSMKEQAFNRKMLSSIERYIKKFPPDITLYVDRADLQTRDLNDLPILRSITSSLGPSIWQHAILALTHAASVPFDGPSGSPLSYEVFVAQKSYLVQQSIREAVRNLCELSPNFMCPVALVENHPLCGKNMSGDCVLPNGLRWRSQLLALCFSLKILSEVSSVSRPQTLFDHWKHSFFHDHSQPLCHVISSLLQSPAHLKFSSNWN